MGKWGAVAIIAALLIVASAAAVTLYPPQEKGVVTVSYGENPRQNMDIYPAGSGNRPVLMFIHGGAWNAGDKSDGAEYADAAESNGCLYVSLNYRLVIEDGVNAGQILDDVGSAISYLKEHASEHGIDTTKMGLFGFSAGSHISMLYAYSRVSPIPIDFVVSTAGPTDLTDPRFYSDYAAMHPEDAAGMLGIINALADTNHTMTELEAQTESSYIPELMDCSPIKYVDGGQPKTLLAYSENDSVVSFTNAERMAKKMADTGSAYDFIRFVHSGHDLSHPYDAEIRQAFYAKFAEYIHGMAH